MKKLGKPLLVLWIIVTIVSLTTMPNMDHLTKEKGQITVPDTEQMRCC
ncbi:putative membrane protein YdfJ with MMPL/SSD domain [Peribacillus simplex]|nr:putative membrane protein YdfJ with MMPL/SSD domain [Peribacillus simplex]